VGRAHRPEAKIQEVGAGSCRLSGAGGKVRNLSEKSLKKVKPGEVRVIHPFLKQPVEQLDVKRLMQEQGLGQENSSTAVCEKKRSEPKKRLLTATESRVTHYRALSIKKKKKKKKKKRKKKEKKKKKNTQKKKNKKKKKEKKKKKKKKKKPKTRKKKTSRPPPTQPHENK